jgi:NADH-quinone oxidoreductase subunit G
MVVHTHLTSEVAREAQEGQLEFLLINHPLDCPMCDKGGECPLQDQTLAHGPPDTRMIDAKRRYEKPIPISAQIALDRERCVLCARCTRFSAEISGDPFIELFERGALEQVAIYADEPYHSYFSGNVIQICPVGALTSTSYRFASRPFDLRSADGVCNQCSAGCNLRVDLRRGEIQRQLARENMAVNEMWNCDKGRFAYAYVAHPDRLSAPRARNEFGAVDPAGWRQALGVAAARLTAAIDEHGPEAVGVIAGGKLTDEDAYAVGRFARDVVGTDNVDFRRAPRDDEERDIFAAIAGTEGPTYDDVENADVVIVAGLDPEEDVPILYLRLRKAWRRHRQRIVGVGPALGSLEGIAWRWIRTPAGAEAQVLAALRGDADAPTSGGDLDELRDAVAEAGSVVVLAGERLAGSPGALRAAARLSRGGVRFAWVSRQTNARGAIDAGLVPGLLPGGRRLSEPGPVTQAWNRVPEHTGLDTRRMLEAARDGRIKALVLVGADPVTDAENPRLAELALARVDSVISLDLLPTASNRYADVLLPACAPQERVGSFTTWEGRRQPFGQIIPPQGHCLEDWDILRQLARTMGTDLGWETAMDVGGGAAPR